jgi:superfamily II DNA or RNA helicase
MQATTFENNRLAAVFGKRRETMRGYEEWQGITPRKWQREALGIVQKNLEEGGPPGVVSAVMGSGKSVFLAEIARWWLLEGAKSMVARVVVLCPRLALVRQLSKTLERRLLAPVGQYCGHAKQIDHPVIVATNRSAGALAKALDEAGFLGRESAPMLLIFDEVHTSEAELVREAIGELNPSRRLGLSATPFRGNKNERITAFEQEIYSYTLGDGIRDGVLVPFRVVNATEEGDLDDVMVSMVRAMKGQGPGIINAPSITSAEEFAARLLPMRAAAIHSRLPLARRDLLVEQLRVGNLDCLVHVSLLAEGVDMPWLRWIGLRREVGSRVRFIQELGRVLRCHPGKTEACVLDPLNLLSRHQMSHVAELGKVIEELSAIGEPQERAERDLTNRAIKRAVAVPLVAGWLLEITRSLEIQRLTPSPQRKDGPWCRQPSSLAQQQALQNMMGVIKVAPPPIMEGLEALCRHSAGLDKKLASLLFGVLSQLHKAQVWCRRHRRKPEWREDRYGRYLAGCAERGPEVRPWEPLTVEALAWVEHAAERRREREKRREAAKAVESELIVDARECLRRRDDTRDQGVES